MAQRKTFKWKLLSIFDGAEFLEIFPLPVTHTGRSDFLYFSGDLDAVAKSG